MSNSKFTTIPQLANMLGVSRIAVYKRVQKGQIPAEKVGNTYIITDKTVQEVLGRKVSQRIKEQIDKTVRETIEEYGQVLKKLGRE